MRIFLFGAILALFLTACSEEKRPYQPPVPQTPASPTAPDPQER